MPSAGEASATWASTRRVDGSSTGNVAADSAGRQAPPMNSPLGTAPTTLSSRARSTMEASEVLWYMYVVDSLPRSVRDGQPLSSSEAGNACVGRPRGGRLPLRRGGPALPRLHRGHRSDQH